MASLEGFITHRPARFGPLRSENERGKASNPYPLTTPDGWNIIRSMQYQYALSHCELTPVRGDKLSARALARADYQTIHINPSCATDDDPRRSGEFRMSCGWTL